MFTFTVAMKVPGEQPAVPHPGAPAVPPTVVTSPLPIPFLLAAQILSARVFCSSVFPFPEGEGDALDSLKDRTGPVACAENLTK